MEDNPHIIITLNKSYLINEIKIYGDIDDKYSIYPLKVELYDDNDNNIIYYYRKSKYSATEVSKDILLYQKYNNEYNLNIKNFGSPDLYRSFCKLSENKNIKDFCKITKNKLTNNYNLECNTIDNNKKFNISNIDIGYNNSQYMKDEDGNGYDNFCRCVGESFNSNVSCFKTTKDGFGDEFTPLNKPLNCYGYTGEQLKNFKPLHIKSKCSISEIKNNVSAGFYNHVNKYYYLFKNTQINNKKLILISLIQKTKNSKDKIKNGYPKIFNENFWANLPKIYYEWLDAVLYIGNNSVILFSNEYCIFYNIKDQSPYYINYNTGDHNFKITKNKKIREVFLALPKSITSVDAVDISDITVKSSTDKLNNFLIFLKKVYNINDIPIDDFQNNLIKNYKIFDKNKKKAVKLITKIINFLKYCVSEKKNIIYFKSNLYIIFNNYYIPKCYLFKNDKYYEYSHEVGSSTPICSKKYLNDSDSIVKDINFNKIDAFVTFYDTHQVSTLLFNKSDVIFYSLNGSNIKPVYSKIKSKYKNLWKVYPNNLYLKNKNIINFTINSLEINDVKNDDIINLKIYYKNKSSEIFNNVNILDITIKFDQFKLHKKIYKIINNKNIEEEINIEVIINEKVYTIRESSRNIVNEFNLSNSYEKRKINEFKIKLEKI